jgi:hypothetical protein
MIHIIVYLELLLRRLLLWTSSTSVLSGVLATDNSGLIDRAKTQSLLKYSVPNTTFQPDWDIVEAIVRTVAQSKLVVTYKYVRGHQDEKTAYELLPFLAQLNVDADTYAGRYQRAYGSHRPIIPLSLTRPIALDLSGRTIHRNMKTEIRDAAHAIPLLNRMIKQNNWTPQVIDLIHWDAHRLATSGAHRLRKTHFVKLCHGICQRERLPTATTQASPTPARCANLQQRTIAIFYNALTPPEWSGGRR